MKKYMLIAVVLALSIFNMAVAFAQDLEIEGGMGCQSLSGCIGSASCNSPGQASGCNIACQNGAQLFCPRE